ncbi:hypothetical protein EDD22DRAFT_955386 [Suillus occidentalis]|nr:hypothetical protein EDD22DRAFT_955386 [Suillus occidentalis]
MQAPESKKHCRHAPSCYKFLSHSRREKHYATTDPNEALCSDSSSSDSEAKEDSQHSSIIIQDAISSHSSHHTDKSSDFESSLDAASSDGSAKAHDLYDFNEDDIDYHAIMTIDNMILELEDWQGPTKARETYDLHLYSYSNMNVNSNVT